VTKAEVAILCNKLAIVARAWEEDVEDSRLAVLLKRARTAIRELERENARLREALETIQQRVLALAEPKSETVLAKRDGNGR
jgi:hypothetical protein